MNLTSLLNFVSMYVCSTEKRLCEQLLHVGADMCRLEAVSVTRETPSAFLVQNVQRG